MESMMAIAIEKYETERTYSSPELARYVALALTSQGYSTKQTGRLLKTDATAKVHQAAIDFVKASHP